MRIQGHERVEHTALSTPRQQDMPARLGMHMGHMAQRRIGADRRLTYIAVGDTIHCATQLMHQAAPGTILLSQAAAQGVQHRVQLTRADACPAGENAPLPAYQVLAVTSWRTQSTRVTRHPAEHFVGREPELTLLQALVQQAIRGRGHVVGIVGKSGIGKSHLLAALRRSLRGIPITSLAGRCRFHGRAAPYLPVCDILRHVCRITEADRATTIAAKVRWQLLALDLDPNVYAPYLLRLLGLSMGTETLAGHSLEALDKTVALLCQMSLHSSQQRPLLLVIEDMHWIDPLSEAVCAALASRLQQRVPLLLLMTHRPGYQPTWLAQSAFTQLTLLPLLPQDSLALIRALCQTTPLSAAVEQEILAQADGHPFLLEELTRAALAQTLHSPT